MDQITSLWAHLMIPDSSEHVCQSLFPHKGIIHWLMALENYLYNSYKSEIFWTFWHPTLEQIIGLSGTFNTLRLNNSVKLLLNQKIYTKSVKCSNDGCLMVQDQLTSQSRTNNTFHKKYLVYWVRNWIFHISWEFQVKWPKITKAVNFFLFLGCFSMSHFCPHIYEHVQKGPNCIENGPFWYLLKI